MEFNFSSKGKTFNEGGTVKKWLTPYTASLVHLYSAELGKSDKKGTPFIKLIIAATEPTEGLVNEPTENKQYVEETFFLTPKTVGSGNLSDPLRFFAILSERVGGMPDSPEATASRAAWEKILEERVGNDIKMYVTAINKFFGTKPFYGLIGAQETIISGDDGDTIWKKPILWPYGTFARPNLPEGKAELEALIDKQGEDKLTIKSETPDDNPTSAVSTSTESSDGDTPAFDDDEW